MELKLKDNSPLVQNCNLLWHPPQVENERESALKSPHRSEFGFPFWSSRLGGGFMHRLNNFTPDLVILVCISILCSNLPHLEIL